MAVDVEGEGDVAVAEAFADDLGVDACLEREGGVCVTQVMEADAREPRVLAVLAEELRDPFRMDGRGVFASEDNVRVRFADPKHLMFECLVVAVGAEGVGGCWVERNHSNRQCPQETW